MILCYEANNVISCINMHPLKEYLIAGKPAGKFDRLHFHLPLEILEIVFDISQTFVLVHIVSKKN